MRCWLRKARRSSKKLIALDENAGYFLERHNHSSDSENSVTDYVVRLFPNRPDYRYRGRVHEIIDSSILSAGGRLHKTQIRIHHSFSSDREARRRKNHWYIEILKEEIAADPLDDAARFSGRRISPARNVRRSYRNRRTHRARAAARRKSSLVPGRLSSDLQVRPGAGASRFQPGIEAPPRLPRSRGISRADRPTGK
jgi:hypothetical protein